MFIKNICFVFFQNDALQPRLHLTFKISETIVHKEAKSVWGCPLSKMCRTFKNLHLLKKTLLVLIFCNSYTRMKLNNVETETGTMKHTQQLLR